MKEIEKDVRRIIGFYCSLLREDLGCTQNVVADATQKSRRLVSHFEHGNSDNINVFLWYIINGLFVYYGQDIYEDINAMRYKYDNSRDSQHRYRRFSET